MRSERHMPATPDCIEEAAAVRCGVAGLLAVALLFLAGMVPAMAACLPVARAPAGIVPVSLPAAGVVELTFLGHASFLIRSAGGASAVTDYNGYIRADASPDIVTMNNAHSTHYTDDVEPGVKHVLRGWDDGTGRAEHNLDYLDMRVRNVPTNVRDWGGTRRAGNSIFVFEVADLCIAHLGHLHHRLTDDHLAALGIIDVVLAPVDGSYTMTQELMVEVIQQLRPSMVVPMHFFSEPTLARFLELIEEQYTVRVSETPTVLLSRATLPHRQLLVLPGY